MDRTKGNEYTVAAGPLRGFDLTIDVIFHDVDAHEDRLALDLWPPEAVAPSHSFETYRHGYGYDQLRAGLLGPQEMAAVGDWWLANHRSLTYAAHRILVAVDTGTTLDRLAADLQLDRADLDLPEQYGRALHTLVTQGLLVVDAGGRHRPTHDVDTLLRSDDRAHASRRLRWFTDLLQTTQPSTNDAAADADRSRRTPGRAFPSLHLPDGVEPTSTESATPVSPGETLGRRRTR